MMESMHLTGTPTPSKISGALWLKLGLEPRDAKMWGR